MGAGRSNGRTSTHADARPRVLAALRDAYPGCPVDDLVDELTVERLRVGDTLCHEGDVADNAWLVVSGRLRVVRAATSAGHPPVVMGDRGPGEMIGEAGLLEGGTRSATVVAHRDSEIVSIDEHWLSALLSRSPKALGALMEVLRKRTGEIGVTDRTFTVVPSATTGSDADAVVRALAALPGTAVVRGGDLEVGPSDGADDARSTFARLEATHERVVIVADPTWTPWTAQAVALADHVVNVIDVTRAATPDPVEIETDRACDLRVAGRTVVIVHPVGTIYPSGTAELLAVRRVDRHLHLRHNDPAHAARVARLLSGTGHALVCAGGGARSLAQLGFFREMVRLGIPVDAAVGTSAGAVVAAIIAHDLGPDEAEHRARAGFVGVSDPTIPIAGLLKGARLWQVLTEEFGDRRIEDCWLPFGCVTTDLTAGRTAFHTSGSIRTTLRASVAIPGVFSPVDIDGHLHIDGGLVDNLPVDLAEVVAPGSVRFAVDVGAAIGPNVREPIPPVVSGVQLLRDRILRRPPSAVPSLASTITQAMLLPATTARAAAAEAADHYFSLPLDEIALLDFNHFDRIVRTGSELSRSQLERWLEDPENAMTALTPPVGATGPSTRVAPAISQGRATLGALWLAVADLRFRMRRFVVAVVAAAVTLMLLLLVTGVVNQLDRESGVTVGNLNGEFWVMRDGVASPFTASAGVYGDDLADQIIVPGAKGAILTGGLNYAMDGGVPTDSLLIGHPDVAGPGTPQVSEGRLAEQPGEVAISTEIPAGIGDKITLGGFELTVVGRIDDVTLFSGMPLVFVPRSILASVVEADRPLVSAVLTDVAPTQVPEGLHAVPASEVADAAKGPVEKPILALHIIRVLLVLVAAMIIGAVVYLASIERTRDVAVLRAVGTKGSMLATGVAAQALAIAVIASVLANVLAVVVSPVFPMAVFLSPVDLAVMPFVAAVIAMGASYAAIRRTLRIDPSAAFAGVGG